MIECIAYRWSPGIGDPTVFGWATVALYVWAAGACFLRARAAFAATPPEPGDPARGRTARLGPFWLSLCVLLILMAINKELDLQSLLTTAGRCLAFEQGWYDARRGVQAAFILALAAAAGLGGAAVLWLMRHSLRRLWLVLTGLGLLVLFVLMRASSFHHMDVFIDTTLMGLRMNWIIEMGALGLIIAGAGRKAPRTARAA